MTLHVITNSEGLRVLECALNFAIETKVLNPNRSSTLDAVSADELFTLKAQVEKILINNGLKPCVNE